ncbi:GNAT family N-acetyltransferase [Chitinimonas sp. BJYL2]|uniref:GNAT family N-acetyltransferase n=1 Tax=Chitinimonas sp. BJYL2 TaxID=2976696 RepID=UPI0022B423E4|nr:GNAT family N-acetyltransferase [Chitinimonas sp. BJYL2]
MMRAATPADIPAVATLAYEIWHAVYPAIIPAGQIDYMLAQRYHADALLAQMSGQDQWLDLLERDGALIGFCQYQRLDAARLKLDKLYLLPAHHGQGLGAAMLRHVDARALSLGFSQIELAVNKRNEAAITAYLRHGYTVARETCVDIGGGFVMDDFVMHKSLTTSRPD